MGRWVDERRQAYAKFFGLEKDPHLRRKLSLTFMDQLDHVPDDEAKMLLMFGPGAKTRGTERKVSVDKLQTN